MAMQLERVRGPGGVGEGGEGGEGGHHAQALHKEAQGGGHLGRVVVQQQTARVAHLGGDS